MIEKFLDLKHLFRKSIKLLRIFLMWHQQSYLQTEKNNSLHFSNKILPLLHLYPNIILSIRTTPQKPLFLMNSSSLFLVGSLLTLVTASASFVTSVFVCYVILSKLTIILRKKRIS